MKKNTVGIAVDWPTIIVKGKKEPVTLTKGDKIIFIWSRWYIDPGLDITDLIPTTKKFVDFLIKSDIVDEKNQFVVNKTICKE